VSLTIPSHLKRVAIHYLVKRQYGKTSEKLQHA